MRVLHVVPSLNPVYGGPSRVVPDLADALAATDIEVDILTTIEDDTKHAPHVLDNKVRVFSVSRTPRSGSFMYSRRLKQWLYQHANDYAVFHIHTLFAYPTFAASRVAQAVKRPYILTPHGMLEPWCLAHKSWKKRPYMQLIESRTLKRAARIHALTAEENRNIKALDSTLKTFVLPNGIKLKEFDSLPSAQDFTDRFPQTKGKTIVLFLGRIDPKKGLDLLVEAFAAATNYTQSRDACLVIAGPDLVNYRSEIETLCAEREITDKVIWTGMLNGKLKLAALAACDIFALPSRSEGFSVAILEAMAAGCAVIMSDACNFPEAARAAVVIKVNVGELTDALKHLLDDTQQQRQAIGRRGAELIRADYDWSSIAKRLEQIYQDVVTPNDDTQEHC